jgi:hypothetical protein
MTTKDIKIDTERLIEIMREINEYDDPRYRYDVAIFPDGSVSCGDLHTDVNSWSVWNEPTLYEFSVRPVYTTEDMRYADDVETDENGDPLPADIEIWDKEADKAIVRWVERFAEELPERLAKIEASGGYEEEPLRGCYINW